jgi:F-type H+-transporting ATPase subunit delta
MTLASLASRRYAEALIGAAGAKDLARASQELLAFAELVEGSDEFRHVLLNPAFSVDEEHKALDAVMERMKLSDVVKRLLTMLAQRERMNEIRDIAETVKRISDERAGRVEAKIETAEELAPHALARLRSAVEKRTGKSVELQVVIDPSLIGGIRTTVGSTVFDGTLATSLRDLRESLVKTD